MQTIIDVHGLLRHCYTNDTQLYFFISEWMSSNRLKLNPSKSEFLYGSPPPRRRLLDYITFALGDIEVRLADTTAIVVHFDSFVIRPIYDGSCESTSSRLFLST